LSAIDRIVPADALLTDMMEEHVKLERNGLGRCPHCEWIAQRARRECQTMCSLPAPQRLFFALVPKWLLCSEGSDARGRSARRARNRNASVDKVSAGYHRILKLLRARM